MTGPRLSRSPWPIAAALCALAVIAVAITVPRQIVAWRTPAPQPIAPGLAALSGQRLAAMLPQQTDFPAGWTPTSMYGARPDSFGYSRYHSIGASFRHEPAECFAVTAGGSTGNYAAAEIAEHDPTDPPYEFPGHADVRVEIGREFDPALLDALIARVSRCGHSSAHAPRTDYAVRVLEDSRASRASRPGDAQLFRYAVTSTYTDERSDEPGQVHVIGTSYYSYARMSGLILTASAGEDRQAELMDSLFESTLRRMQAAR